MNPYTSHNRNVSNPYLDKPLQVHYCAQCHLCTVQSKGDFCSPKCENSTDTHKAMYCKGCEDYVLIPRNQPGGYWHLTGWENPHGLKFWGGYCSDCFHKLDEVKS